MRYILKLISRFSVALVFSAGLMASPVSAQNKTEIASACIQAIEAGDTEDATELATQIMEWKHLFSITIIKNAEQCLQAVTGGQWKYFTTKGRFLSDSEALAEQAYIDGSDDRKAAQEKILKRQRCEVTIAMFEFGKLEEEYKNTKEARTVEALRATLNACTQVYEVDHSAALLSPVCNEVFKSMGIPDTEYAFDYTKLEAARLKLAVSEINLWKALNRNAKMNEVTNQKFKKCQELIAE